MQPEKRKHPKEKSGLHPRNRHRGRYDFEKLIKSCPELAGFVFVNPYGDLSVDFSDAGAVKVLNRALLKHFYGVDHWDIPPGYLCPPIPGRADYIHHMADLLASCNKGVVPRRDRVKALDVGVGASCIYPILGIKEYGWSFIGADISPGAIKSSERIISLNPSLAGKVEFRLQKNSRDFFRGIIREGETIDLTVCNPPFHSSEAEAREGTLRKLSNLNRKRITSSTLNFGGKNNELWCQGGELRFVRDMIFQSRQFSENCFWFSSLVSKQANLKGVYDALKKAGAVIVKTLPMGQGNKISRVVAWTYLSPEQQNKWSKDRWKEI